MDRVAKMKGIELSSLKIIKGQDGMVMHALKDTEESFIKFGEAYFSTVNYGSIKGWKKHTKMVSNLVVPHGEVQFVFYDDRNESITKGCFFAVNLSQANYKRLTVQPGLWMAFKGISKEQNTILNLASIRHDPNEVINDPIENSMNKYPIHNAAK